MHIPLPQDITEKHDSTRVSGSDILSIAAKDRRPMGVASRPAGYRMIESVEIRNFRLFESLDLSGFKRVNIVVGDNGARKTSLLEALFAAGVNSVEIGTRLRLWRGLDITLPSSPQEIYDGLFLSMFF
ncbi:MAG TPA: hypothetical protein VHT02_02050, partial [Methylocella sp.]|nr:hypothetical protein [Methylocella sp.]